MRRYLNSSKSSASTAGIGFHGLLTIAFIVLKLVGVIDWPWVWVLAPAWISAALVVVILFVALLVYCIKFIK